MFLKFYIFICLFSAFSLMPYLKKDSLGLKSFSFNNFNSLNKIKNGMNASICNHNGIFGKNGAFNSIKNSNLVHKSHQSEISNSNCINCGYHTTFKLPKPLRIKNPDRIFTINNIHGVKVIGNVFNTKQGARGNVLVNQNKVSANAIVGNIINTNIVQN